MKLIHNAKARAVERDPDAVPDGPASCSDDEGDDFDKDKDDEKMMRMLMMMMMMMMMKPFYSSPGL